jgi:peptidoglycan/LPS O-acetylase OafA/YrhL
MHPINYRPEIDGMRALAIISVVIFHAFPTKLPGGFIGVDIFFVISGYLITTIILKGLIKGNFSFTTFYIRRIKRLLPSLLIVLIASLILGWYSILSDEYMQLGKHAMAGIGFVSNLMLISEAGYFDNSAHSKPLLHLWSLAIEEQFYIVWPAFLTIIWRLKLPLSIAISILIILSFIFNIEFFSIDTIVAFYSPITRFWELLIGASIAYFTLFHSQYIFIFQSNYTISNTLSFTGLFTIILGLFIIDKDNLFSGYWALIPIIGSSLIILSGSKPILNRVILQNKLAIFFGIISYPLYLWHWPILTFLRIIKRDENPDKVLIIFALILSISFAWITYWFIENRIRYSTGYKFIPLLFALSIITFLAGFITYQNYGFTERKAVTSSDFSKKVQYQFMGPHWIYSVNKKCLKDYKYDEQDDLAWWFCIKNKDNSPSILLQGNSFANQLYPGFSTSDALSHHTILSIGTCSVDQVGTDVDPRNPCYGNGAKKQKDFINNIISRTTSLKYVIIDGLKPKPTESNIDALVKQITWLNDKGLEIIIFVPHLRPNFDPKECFKSPFRSKTRDCLIPYQDWEKLLDNFKPTIDAIKMSFPNILIFDQNIVYCDRKDNKCSFVHEGIPLVRDYSHISEYGSVKLQEYFNKWAEVHIPSIHSN